MKTFVRQKESDNINHRGRTNSKLIVEKRSHTKGTYRLIVRTETALPAICQTFAANENISF